MREYFLYFLGADVYFFFFFHYFVYYLLRSVFFHTCTELVDVEIKGDFSQSTTEKKEVRRLYYMDMSFDLSRNKTTPNLYISSVNLRENPPCSLCKNFERREHPTNS